ncbi:MAG: HRDC domain-containing protein, partial [Bacteroidales bacterium]|nr:HRDC domain-containing protein [Bacteroidales bacterium]
TQDHEFEESDEDDVNIGQAGKSGSCDEELFAMLKDLRKKIAKKKNLPPFVVFQDPSLEDMAIQYPITIDELQNITGVGAGKAKRYGKDFIELIAAYVEDKEIIRPLDMVVKSVANKSLLKVFIIQSIDRKMDLEDIANAKDLDMSELITEIEAIVNSGTKLNIDYYIQSTIDNEKVDEIFDYFREEAETESIEEAIEYLGEEDFTEEEIRLVRVQFISEIGN